MEAERWETFIHWLSSSGLLTSKVQSREPIEGMSTSLDGLRRGDAGSPIESSSVNVDALQTSAYLP